MSEQCTWCGSQSGCDCSPPETPQEQFFKNERDWWKNRCLEAERLIRLTWFTPEFMVNQDELERAVVCFIDPKGLGIDRPISTDKSGEVK